MREERRWSKCLTGAVLGWQLKQIYITMIIYYPTIRQSYQGTDIKKKMRKFYYNNFNNFLTTL